MHWNLDGNSPIYQQIVQQITVHIVRGVLPAGSKVPPVRQLAEEAGVNPNTMQRALAELERDGLLYTNRTSGRFVTEDENVINKLREHLASTYISVFLDQMQHLGFTTAQIQALVGSAVQKGESV